MLRFAALLTLILVAGLVARADEAKTGKWPEAIQTVLDECPVLDAPSAIELPLYLWPAILQTALSDDRADELVELLHRRGIGLIARWDHRNTEKSLAACLPVARAQARRGLRVNISAIVPLYHFFDGSEGTAHLDENGNPFFDDTFENLKMGCPFRVAHRIDDIRNRINTFVKAYEAEDLPIGFVFSDWEVDGPIEWNGTQAASRRCVVCREHLGDSDDFMNYQYALRQVRSRLQREAYARPILDAYPDALVGNYAVYPHDGWRYWYDYFERYTVGMVERTDQRARYRHWANEFEQCGYTFAMPVVYPWAWTWNWYDFEPGDYRWFYNGLLVISNAGQHTADAVPIIPFVHWHTVERGRIPDDTADTDALEDAQQMSEECYRELLWHILLRGADTLFLFCVSSQNAQEVQLVHGVWAEAQQYAEFINDGRPVTFDVPPQPGPVVSGLRLGNRVLVRRSDFTDAEEPVTLRIDDLEVRVPRREKACQVFNLD